MFDVLLIDDLQVAPTVADVPEEVLPGRVSSHYALVASGPTGPLAYVADTVRKAITYSEEELSMICHASSTDSNGYHANSCYNRRERP